MMWVHHTRKLGLMIGLLVTTLPAISSETLVSGVVVDGDRLFMMNPAGTLDALSLESGSVLWSSAAAAKPLVLSNEVLVSQAESLKKGVFEVVFLNKDTGAVANRLSISVPNQVWAQVSHQLGRKFTASGGLRSGELYLAWEQFMKRVGGAFLPQTSNSTQKLTEAYRLDLPGNTYQSADVSILENILPALPDAMSQLFQQGQLSGEALFTGNMFAATSIPTVSGYSIYNHIQCGQVSVQHIYSIHFT